ncbi:MAG: zinc ribbon domain-containing protein [Clostridia bacterium]|jgi:hypothetical protein|nr:zinc ribbon domain-containing protein [Clostridia bacterium]
MFCIKCGNELNSNDIFCSRCGTKQKSTNLTSNVSKKKGKITGIGPGIILILVIVLIGFFINMTTKKTDNNYSQFISLGITSEKIRNIFAIIEQCGFVNYEIEKDNSLDNLEEKRNNRL